jgi:hypothetical protein
MPQLTPAVIEDVFLAEPHSDGERAAREGGLAAVPRQPGRLVARVHLRLQSTLGAITVESIPSGAELVIDGRPVGRTPATLEGLRIDERHRIDLVLLGHEIDQFVVLPEKDGRRFVRRLTRLDPRGAKAPPSR